MDLKKHVKIFLGLLAILLMATVVPVTFADDTQSSEFKATQAELVNFLMHLNQTLTDFDEYAFNEELLDSLEVEINLALTVAQRSHTMATIEYSLGFLRVSYTALLEDAIEREIDLIGSLVNELDESDEHFDRVTETIENTLEELEELGIEFNDDDADEEDEVTVDVDPEISVRELPDLTSDLRTIFDTLVETRELLAPSSETLGNLDGSDLVSNETGTDASRSQRSSESQIRGNDCPSNDNTCQAALFQIARFELQNLLITVDPRNADHVDLESELLNAIQHAIRALTGHDVETMITALETLENVLASLE